MSRNKGDQILSRLDTALKQAKSARGDLEQALRKAKRHS